MAQTGKHLPTMQETWVRSLGREDPLEKEMATHSSTLAWKIPWMEDSNSPWGRKELDTTVTSLSLFHLIKKKKETLWMESSNLCLSKTSTWFLMHVQWFSDEQFCPKEDIWNCLEAVLGCHNLSGEDSATSILWYILQCTGQPPPHPNKILTGPKHPPCRGWEALQSEYNFVW